MRRLEGKAGGLAIGAASLLLLVRAPGQAPAPTPAPSAPQPMGSVSTRDAQVGGGLEVGGEIARLVSNASVTANGRAAPVALNRGGHVLVCSTSEFHLLRAGASGALMFGLNRGAIEIYSGSEMGDVVLTPDLKITPVTKGSYDLRLRVTNEGDTCIENAGKTSPVLNVTDAFSSASYRVLPGQHLLFVGGDLHKVVDQERSPCGCPSALPPMIAANGKPMTAAAAAHPFPAAQSQGLAPTATPSNEAPVGSASSQVTTSFSYDNGQGTPPAGGVSPAIASTTAVPQKSGGFGAAVRHFFHKLFHPHS